MKRLNIKKVVTTLLATTLAATSLAACGGSNSADATVAATAAANSETEVIKVVAATRGTPAPYITIDENNQAQGSDIEILKAIFDTLPQYELEVVVTDDPLTGLTSGLYDIAVNNYGWREERGETYYYSYPYKKVYDVFIQRKDDEPIKDFIDLADRGYKTEVSAGSAKASALEAWNASNPDHKIELVYSETDFQQKFQNIVDGKTDVAIDDGPILDTLISKFGLENDLVGNPIDDATQKLISEHNSTYFLFPKDDKGNSLRSDVNAGIKSIKDDGTLAKILTDYFGGDTSPAVDELVAPN